jgi:hypothetical protein
MKEPTIKPRPQADNRFGSLGMSSAIQRPTPPYVKMNPENDGTLPQYQQQPTNGNQLSVQ